MTQPAVESQSGRAADAVRTLQNELSKSYSDMRSAEVQLTEAILSAHAVTVSGRARLQDIQRQLIEAINNPVAALDTPAGERQFLMFLRSKIAEIQGIVDAGALTDEDHAKLTRALGSGYLLAGSQRGEPMAPATAQAGAPMADEAAGMVPAIGSALGSLPQAAQGAAAAPAQGAGGLAGAASPLAGLVSGLLERGGHADIAEDSAEKTEDSDERAPDEEDYEAGEDDEAGEDVEDDARDRPADPHPPSDREPPTSGPAQTRPARLL
ncbi:DUF4226 domain-containing protein [Mycobacterium sp. ITM-2016-00318]|uniref:DUF4226 domain-containing protein n=1 Tax=Mycobacterium sp. ITM-2016-00318 TaxID=2099693 RepID=UPI00287FAAF6|nr:DUF4226 domain-containing protein [Mycobacterium sp. ITM-2016-00318]WNG92995.1 DUF4226 domain-containing protein [Mycobacterium sp. ITM-2016-00318]